MKTIMFIRWGANGPESSPQSVRGDNSDAWLPCIMADVSTFNPLTQTVEYHRHDNIVTQYITGDATPSYAELRHREYPSLRDQLDAIWKGGLDMDAMRTEVLAIKTKYPKPSSPE